MGIQGLIRFMDKASRQVHISRFAGCCVAIDAYCWLHKGAYSCAEKLARGEDCWAYIHYCLKFINMLLSFNIKPILVFDGRYLPAKADTEKKRRETREMSRKRAAELLRAGKPDEARNFLKRCIDISHKMALKLIKQCRQMNVDCIVAPYEADAQLAYLNINNIAQVVITEDSDLVLFGCSKIMFKMDQGGNGLLVEQDRLHQLMGQSFESFSFDKFRYMCILSGCDYLPSLPGIGLSKARKFITTTVDPDIYRALGRLPINLNMNHLSVSKEYRENFLRADAAFRYQLVFDPVSRKMVPLTKPPEGHKMDKFAGELLPDDVAFQLALGNLDPFTLSKVDNFNPDLPQHKVKNLKGKKPTSQWSIWSQDYRPGSATVHVDSPKVERAGTRGKIVTAATVTKKPATEDKLEDSSEVDLMSMYCISEYSEPPAKKVCANGHLKDSSLTSMTDTTASSEEQTTVTGMKSPYKSIENSTSSVESLLCKSPSEKNSVVSADNLSYKSPLRRRGDGSPSSMGTNTLVEGEDENCVPDSKANEEICERTVEKESLKILNVPGFQSPLMNAKRLRNPFAKACGSSPLSTSESVVESPSLLGTSRVRFGQTKKSFGALRKFGRFQATTLDEETRVHSRYFVSNKRVNGEEDSNRCHGNQVSEVKGVENLPLDNLEGRFCPTCLGHHITGHCSMRINSEINSTTPKKVNDGLRLNESETVSTEQQNNDSFHTSILCEAPVSPENSLLSVARESLVNTAKNKVLPTTRFNFTHLSPKTPCATATVKHLNSDSNRSKSSSFKWQNLKNFTFKSSKHKVHLTCLSSKSVGSNYKNPCKKVSKDLPGTEFTSLDGDAAEVAAGSHSSASPEATSRAAESCRRPGLARTTNQQTLLHMFGFQNKKQKIVHQT